MSWTQKYEPETLDDFVGNENVVEFVQGIIEDGEPTTPIIFLGKYGLGKTTLAKIMAREMLDKPEYNYIYIDCAKYKESLHEVGFNAIRRAGTSSLASYPDGDSFGVVLFDGMDVARKSEQEKLRHTVEESSYEHQLIFTANELDGIDPAIQSRASVFHFNKISRTKIKNRLEHILEQEGIEKNDSLIEQILDLTCKNGRGDLRNSINRLESFSRKQKLR